MVLQWVEQKGKEKRTAGVKNGGDTAHFQSWVATQKWCRHRLGLARESRRASQARGLVGASTTAAERACDSIAGARHGTFAARSRHQFLCRGMVEVGTGLALGRDMISMSWQGQPLGCRDMTFGVAIEKPHYGLKWCRDTRP